MFLQREIFEFRFRCAFIHPKNATDKVLISLCGTAMKSRKYSMKTDYSAFKFLHNERITSIFSVSLNLVVAVTNSHEEKMSLQSSLSAFAVYTNKDLREPEVHIIGEITGASELSVDNSYCAFEIKTGKFWSCVGGDVSGQTQVDYPDGGEGSMVIWNHPIDVHYYTKTLEGWPKLAFEVRSCTGM